MDDETISRALRVLGIITGIAIVIILQIKGVLPTPETLLGAFR